MTDRTHVCVAGKRHVHKYRQWSFNSGGLCNAGASIADGMVLWGYRHVQGRRIEEGVRERQVPA